MYRTLKQAALGLAIFTAALSAHAVEAHITVWANVDPTLSLLRADGSALPADVEMPYRAGQGLSSWSERVRVFSNDTSLDVDVRLAEPAVLMPKVTAAGAVDIPLSVTLNGRELGLAPAVRRDAVEIVRLLLEAGAPDSPLRRKPILLLARNPLDIAVSWYFQFTRRQSAHKQELINHAIAHPIDRRTISLWDFVRHSDIGLPSLIDYLNRWERNLAGLERDVLRDAHFREVDALEQREQRGVKLDGEVLASSERAADPG